MATRPPTGYVASMDARSSCPSSPDGRHAYRAGRVSGPDYDPSMPAWPTRHERCMFCGMDHVTALRDSTSTLAAPRDYEYQAQMERALDIVARARSRDARVVAIPSAWLRPVSPRMLAQELVRDDWGVIVACVCCALTMRRASHPALWAYLHEFPTPSHAVYATEDDFRRVFGSIGLWQRRMHMLRTYSAAWTAGERPGSGMRCGRYAEDSYRIFVLGETYFLPDDKELRAWLLWRATGVWPGTSRRA